MLAFHNSPLVKEKYLKRAKLHREQDDLRRGFYWNSGRGCGVGCLVEKSHDVHRTCEEEMNIPAQLFYLQDIFFENMTYEDALEYPEKFLRSISVGADLSKVADYFILWLLSDKEHGIINLATKTTKETIGELASLVHRKIQGETFSGVQWEVYRFDGEVGPGLGKDKDSQWFTECAVVSTIDYYMLDEPDLVNIIVHSARAQNFSDSSEGRFIEYFDIMATQLIELLSAASVVSSVNMLTPTKVEVKKNV